MEKYASKDQELVVKLLLRSSSCPFKVEVGKEKEAKTCDLLHLLSSMFIDKIRIEGLHFNVTHRTMKESLVAELFNGDGHTLVGVCLQKIPKSRCIRNLHRNLISFRDEHQGGFFVNYQSSVVRHWHQGSCMEFFIIPQTDNYCMTDEWK